MITVRAACSYVPQLIGHAFPLRCAVGHASPLDSRRPSLPPGRLFPRSRVPCNPFNPSPVRAHALLCLVRIARQTRQLLRQLSTQAGHSSQSLSLDAPPPATSVDRRLRGLASACRRLPSTRPFLAQLDTPPTISRVLLRRDSWGRRRLWVARWDFLKHLLESEVVGGNCQEYDLVLAAQTALYHIPFPGFPKLILIRIEPRGPEMRQPLELECDFMGRVVAVIFEGLAGIRVLKEGWASIVDALR